MKVLEVFPRRPLQIVGAPHRAFRSAIVPLLVGACFAWMAIDGAMGLRDEFRLRNSAVVAQQSRVKKVTRRAYVGVFLPTYTVEGSYQTADGVNHDHDWKYDLLFSGFPSDIDFTVRYDPAAPERTITSWGQALLVKRIVMITLFPVPFTLLFLFLAINPTLDSIRARRKLKAIGANPVPVEAHIVPGQTSERSAHSPEFRWTDPVTGEAHVDRTLFSGKPKPFWLDRSHTSALALAQNGSAHLLDAELKTVQLTAEERASVLAAQNA